MTPDTTSSVHSDDGNYACVCVCMQADMSRRVDVLFSLAKFAASANLNTLTTSTSTSIVTSLADMLTRTCTVDEESRVDEVDDVLGAMRDRRLVRVTGHWVHSDTVGKVLWFMSDGIMGHHVKTIPIVAINCYGMAVNESESVMALTNYNHGDFAHKLYLYSLPDGKLVNTIGGNGSHLVLFNYPFRVCFGPKDTILVAEFFANRVQELSITGERIRVIPVEQAWSVCVSNNRRMIGVGTRDGVITLLEYVSGTVIQTTEASKSRFASQVSGLRFTRDDTMVLAGDLYKMKVLSVADLTIVKEMTVAGKSFGLLDMLLCSNDEMIVADCAHGRICVYDNSGDVLLREWGRPGSEHGQFSNPTALSLVHGRLYVLEAAIARVQVFE